MAGKTPNENNDEDQFDDLDRDDDIMFADDDDDLAPAKPAKVMDVDDDDVEDEDGDEEVVFMDAGDDGATDEDDDDAGDFSDKVSKRIGRERRLKEKSEREAATLRAQYEEARREIEEARAEANKHRRLAIEASLDRIKGMEKDLYAEMRQARDDGDFDKEAAVQQKIADLKVTESRFLDSKRALGDTDDKVDLDRPPEQAPASRGGAGAAQAKATSWLSHNGWFNDPQYEVEKSAAVVISRKLAAEGISPSDDRHYRELAVRMVKKFGDLPVKTHDGKQAVRKDPRRRGRTGGVDTNGRRKAPEARRQSGLTLTPEEREVYRALKLDLDDPAVIKELKKNRAEAAKASR